MAADPAPRSKAGSGRPGTAQARPTGRGNAARNSRWWLALPAAPGAARSWLSGVPWTNSGRTSGSRFACSGRRRSVTAMAIATLATGIGANATIFSAVSALLLRPLPIPDADRLVFGVSLREGFDPFGTSLLDYLVFRNAVPEFSSTGVALQRPVNVSITRRIATAPSESSAPMCPAPTSRRSRSGRCWAVRNRRRRRSAWCRRDRGHRARPVAPPSGGRANASGRP